MISLLYQPPPPPPPPPPPENPPPPEPDDVLGGIDAEEIVLDNSEKLNALKLDSMAPVYQKPALEYMR